MMCKQCLCRTCVNNCDGEHWPFVFKRYGEDVQEKDFCYPCEDDCYQYDFKEGKRQLPVTECPRYIKSKYYEAKGENK